jgi:hypothetical protein
LVLLKRQEKMTKGIVISLYDFTGEALRPWADAGYECYAFDIQHDWYESTKVYSQKHVSGSIEYRHADLHKQETFQSLIKEFGDNGDLVVFGMAFPVCTDMAV